ncbi:MAG TPA: ABC transporter permease, partial [SAR324 cluster bacterium]|nr:ABC transporter permease [SAR324 cluster bacterium]
MNEKTENLLLVTLITTVNLLLAFIISGFVIWSVGEDPWFALKTMLYGAFGYDEGIGYTLYYTTNFIFTGLAFAIAFHCRLFNIGAEGQAYIGGLGVGLICLWLEDLPFAVILPTAIAASALFGAVWGAIPGYLQAKRGSHVVITTIMFNFIASVLMVYLLVNILIKPGQMSPETREFGENGWLPQMHELFGWIGIQITPTPLNLSLFWAFISAFFVWRYIWHTRWGFEMRTVGANESAAIYAGINVDRNIIIAMSLAGALAGFVGINEIMGFNHRILLNFQFGYGFT